MYDNAGTETATDDETATEAAWLTVTPTSGAAGEQTVELTAAPKITEESRTAYVDIACGEESVRLTVTQTGASDETNFSALFDKTFAQKLQGLEIISDAEKITLQEMAEIATITELDVSRSSSLTSLQGIEYFESLTELQCYENQLTELDLSNNTALTTLYCQTNRLTELDLSNNTALTTLHCSFNELASLNVSNNTELKELDCYKNQLTKLDVSNNTKLARLDCYDNLLKELDISKNTALIYLECSNNPGDRESKFPVTVWFDNTAVPGSLYIPYTSWTYNGKTIAIDYRTATAE